MINIVIYGKPRAFESHEYGFDADNATAVDNSFPEPILKPKNYREMVLHYFSRDGYSGLECYNRAKGYESERDGIVFGIALKTNHDFDITKVVDNVLVRYWSDFASVLLTEEERFAYPSILAVLNGTKWGDEDVLNIRGSIEQASPRVPNKKICLLYAPEYDQISVVESLLKEYEDVYISDNLDIFKDSINKVVLNLTGGKIHTIKDGSIVEYYEGNVQATPSSRKKPYKWGNGKRTPKGPEDNAGSNIGIEDDGGGDSDNRKGMIAIAIAAAIVAFVVLFFVFRSPKSEVVAQKPGTDTTATTGAGGSNASGTMETPPLSEEVKVNVQFKTFNNPIKESFRITPTIQKSDNSPVVTSDIKFEVDNLDIVEIINENNNPTLKVKNRPNVETTVTVFAKYKETVIGSQQYIIAKKETGTIHTAENSGQQKKYVDPIKPFYKDNHNVNTVHQVLEHEIVTVKDAKGNNLSGGNWTIEDGIVHSSETSDNPFEFWAKKAGVYTLKYTYTDNDGRQKTISCQFICQ